MYAIKLDIDQIAIRETFNAQSEASVYSGINRILEKYGFKHRQGSIYFGDADRVNAVTCVLAVQELAKTYDWFSTYIKDARMLRIEDETDLMPAVSK